MVIIAIHRHIPKMSIIDDTTCDFAKIAMCELQYKEHDGLKHRPPEAATIMFNKSRISNIV